MKVSYVRGKFIIHSTYAERDIPKQTGFKWDENVKRWSTEDYHIAQKLSLYCDESAVHAINSAVLQSEQEVRDSAKVDSEIALFHPEGLDVYPFQQAGVEYITQRDGCLLADEMGLGKTIQAILTINARTCEVLVLCPKIAKPTWLNELRKWLIGEYIIYVYEPTKVRYLTHTNTNHNKMTKVHVINYDLLRKFGGNIMKVPFNFFIADESHALKNPTAKRTKLAMELADKSKYKLFITGTPIYNKPKDLYTTLHCLDPKLFPNFRWYTRHYCAGRLVQYGDKSYYKDDGSSNVDELNHLLRSAFMIRRLKKDVLKDLPSKIKDMVVVDSSTLSDAVEREKEVIKKLKDVKEKMKGMELADQSPLTEAAFKQSVKSLRESHTITIGELAKVRHELADLKVPYVIDFVKNILENSESKEKVVVFSYHRSVAKSLYEGFSEYNPVVITGETKGDDREKYIKDFQEKEDVRIFIGNMAATGVAITLTQAHFCVFAELDWTPAVVQQSEDRLHRIGQENTVWVYYVVANDSIDSKIAKMIVEKQEAADEILKYNGQQLRDKVLKEYD